jgi:2-haloacid dehalogenase
MSEQPIIVFDVNETLLDLDSIRPTFDRIFSDPAAMRLWFAGLITYSEALTLAGVYVPFTDIGGAVLRMLAATRGITISDADAAELTERFAAMPPHPEVLTALRRLRVHGFRLFTLTDNTLEISGRQLERAGMIDLFERRFSVDETGRRGRAAAGYRPRTWYLASVASFRGFHHHSLCRYQSMVAASPDRMSP